MSSQYSERWLTNGWDRFGSLGAPQPISTGFATCFVNAPTSFNGGQPNFARCLAISCAGTLHFGGLLTLTEFCHVQNSLCVQVLRSPILAALLYGTRAVGVRKTLRRGIFTRQGGHPVRHWAVELSSLTFLLSWSSATWRLTPTGQTDYETLVPSNTHWRQDNNIFIKR